MNISKPSIFNINVEELEAEDKIRDLLREGEALRRKLKEQEHRQQELESNLAAANKKYEKLENLYSDAVRTGAREREESAEKLLNLRKFWEAREAEANLRHQSDLEKSAMTSREVDRSNEVRRSVQSSELARVSAENSELKRSLEARISQLAKEKEELQSANQKLGQRNEELSTKASKGEMAAYLMEEVKRLEGEAAEMRIKNEALSRDVPAAEQNNKALLQEKEEMRVLTARLRGELQALEEALDRTRQERDRAIKKARELEEGFTQKAEEFERKLEQEKMGLLADKKVLERRLEEGRMEAQALQLRLTTESEDRQQRLREITELDRLRNERLQMEDALFQKDRLLKELSLKVEQAMEQNARLQGLQVAQHDFEELLKQNSELKLNLIQLQVQSTENVSLRSRLAEKERAFSELQLKYDASSPSFGGHVEFNAQPFILEISSLKAKLEASEREARMLKR